MSRIKNTKMVINYLKKYINCEHIENFLDKNIDEEFINSSSCYMDKKLNVKNISVSCKIIDYSDNKDKDDDSNDSNDSNDKDDGDDKDDSDDGDDKDDKYNSINRTDIDNIFKYFDFITEANHTGFEHFPYLYGVLDCRNGINSKVYVMFENFQGNLIDLINTIEHSSEWYDIAFQVVMINYFTFDLNRYRYPNGSVHNHMYNKLDKPYYQDYELDGVNIKVNHKYIIVMWNLKLSNDMKNTECISSDEIMIDGFSEGSNPDFKTNVQFLLQYITENDTKIKIKPSPRITGFLKEVIETPSDTVKLILQYYGTK